MPELYVAEWTDPQGVPRLERMEAPSRAAALSRLSEEARAGLQRLGPEAEEPRVGALAAVAHYLATLTRRGVPLQEALRAWGASSDALGGLSLSRAAAKAEEGASLAEALAAEGGVFASAPVQALLGAGSRGRFLPATLDALAEVATGLERARRHVWAGLAYPTVVATLGSLITALALTLGAAALTPSAHALWATDPTIVSRALSLSAAHPWFPWLLSLGMSVALWAGWFAAPRWWAGSLRGARARDLFALRLLSALCAQGVPTPEAWGALSTTLLVPGRGGVSEGGTLANALRAARMVSDLEALGLLAAEEGGVEALAHELEALAEERLKDEAERARVLGFLLEVLLLVSMGACLIVAARAAIPLGFRL